jgi:hypothetical protein
MRSGVDLTSNFREAVGLVQIFLRCFYFRECLNHQIYNMILADLLEMLLRR